MLEKALYERLVNKTDKIPKMKQALQDGKITIDEYNTELKNLKDILTEIVKKTNVMRDNVRKQDKKIENKSIISSIVVKDIEDNIDQLEHDNKSHLKATFKIKTKAHDNEYEIRGIKKEIEKHSLKLNTGNEKLGGAWQLHSDEEIYPILKQGKMNHWSK